MIKSLVKFITILMISLIILTSLFCFDDEMYDSVIDENTTFISGFARFPVTDTGQTRHFSSRFGDDSDHSESPVMSYTDQGDGTIRDNITGLEWAKCTIGENGQPDNTDDCSGTHGKYNWNNAVKACRELGLSGKTGWRLPNAAEMMTLLDFGNTDDEPTINKTYFPHTEFFNCSGKYTLPENIRNCCRSPYSTSEPGSDHTDRYWTSDSFGPKEIYWSYNFDDGHLNVHGKDKAFFVRCVKASGRN